MCLSNDRFEPVDGLLKIAFVATRPYRPEGTQPGCRPRGSAVCSRARRASAATEATPLTSHRSLEGIEVIVPPV